MRKLSRRIKVSQEGQFSGAMVAPMNIKVETPLVGKIEQALRKLYESNPQAFRGIKYIRVLASGPYGQWRSDEPETIYININAIENKMRQGVPEEEALQNALSYGIAQIAVHEMEHARGAEEPGAQAIQQKVSPEIFQG